MSGRKQCSTKHDKLHTWNRRMIVLKVFTDNAHLSLPTVPQPEQGAGAGRGIATVMGDPSLESFICMDTEDIVSLFI